MKSKTAFSSRILSLIGLVFLMQITASSVMADNDGSPITSPITAPITAPIVNPTPTPAPQSNNNSSSQPSTGGPAQAPVCGDSKPVSAPKLVYAANTGRNEVTLVWTKALNPVSYYLVAYGTKPGAMEYGNPNVGGPDTIKYTIKGLNNGKTYYFKVRAGNGCMPGDFSNEVAVKVSGNNITNEPATGFKAGVLGSNKQKEASDTAVPFKPITSASPSRIIVSSESFLTKVVKFFTNIFKK